MTIKKLTFCILCSVNAANLATEEDFNHENSSNSKVEEEYSKMRIDIFFVSSFELM